MLNLLTSLTHHQSWADATLLTAVQAHPNSLHDEQMLKTLHHIVMVQRLYPARFLNRPFDKEKESQRRESFDQLVQLYRATHEELLAFVTNLTESRSRAEIRAARPEIPAHHRRRTHPDRHAQPEPSRTVPHPPPRKRSQAAHPRLHPLGQRPPRTRLAATARPKAWPSLGVLVPSPWSLEMMSIPYVADFPP